MLFSPPQLRRGSGGGCWSALSDTRPKAALNDASLLTMDPML